MFIHILRKIIDVGCFLDFLWQKHDTKWLVSSRMALPWFFSLVY